MLQSHQCHWWNGHSHLLLRTTFHCLYIIKHNVLIIGGDMNAQIGKDWNNKFFLHNSPNIIGKYLANFSFENRHDNMRYSLALKTYGEKRSDVHTKDKRIRKEISPRTKASPAEKLNKIEKLHQPNTSIVCLSNTTKAIISGFNESPDRQKMFRIDCGIPHRWIFQSLRSHRGSW